jgi:hypothetical protein
VTMTRMSPARGYTRLRMVTPSKGEDRVAVTLDQGGYPKRPKGYVRWKIRIRASLAYRCRWLAEREGWETADLLRVLLCLSATPKFLSLPRNERFQKLVKLRGITGKRVYGPRVGGGHTVLLSVRLPQGPSWLITTYADLTGHSRNELIVRFIEMGLVIYLKAQNVLLEAIRSIRSDLNGHL